MSSKKFTLFAGVLAFIDTLMNSALERALVELPGSLLFLD
jgi:hypothetical protein